MRKHAACVQEADSAASTMHSVSVKFVTPKDKYLQQATWTRGMSRQSARARLQVPTAVAHPAQASRASPCAVGALRNKCWT